MFMQSKKDRTFILASTLITSLFIMAAVCTIVNGVLSTPLISMNYQQLVSSGNVHHTAIIVYCLVGIVAYRLKLDRSPYEILQILIISHFDKTPLKELLTN